MNILITTYREEELRALISECREQGINIIELFMPYPVSLDDYPGKRKSRIPYLAFIAGLIGLILSLCYQYWTATDYPLNLGGKPFFSWIAAIPVTFEFTVLFTIMTIFIGFLFRKRSLGTYKANKLKESLGQECEDSFAVVINIESEADFPGLNNYTWKGLGQ